MGILLEGEVQTLRRETYFKEEVEYVGDIERKFWNELVSDDQEKKINVKLKK